MHVMWAGTKHCLPEVVQIFEVRSRIGAQVFSEQKMMLLRCFSVMCWYPQAVVFLLLQLLVFISIIYSFIISRNWESCLHVNTFQILAENHMVVPKNGVQKVPVLSHSLILWGELHLFSVGAKTFCKALSCEHKVKFTLFGEKYQCCHLYCEHISCSLLLLKFGFVVVWQAFQ